MFERLGDDNIAPWIWRNTYHAEFSKQERRFSCWYFAVLNAHNWFVDVLGDVEHEEHWRLWGRHEPENNWPDSVLLGKRKFRTPLVITPIERGHAYDIQPGWPAWVNSPMFGRNFEEGLPYDPPSDDE